MSTRNEATLSSTKSVRGDAASAPAAASALASVEALRDRVAELERQLAAEREQSAHMARNVERGVSALRKSLKDMHDEVDRAHAENKRLASQLEQSRQVVAAMSGAAVDDEQRRAAERAALAASEALARLREEHAAVLEDSRSLSGAHAAAVREIDELRRRILTLESDVEARDLEASRASERADALEAEMLQSRSRAGSDHAAVEPADEHDFLTVDAPEVVEVPALREESPRPAPAPTATATASATATATAAASSRSEPRMPDESSLRAAAERNDAQHAASGDAVDPSLPQVPGVRIERLVEDGATGRVYEAREVESRRPVVVRLLPGVLKLLDGKRLDSVLLAKHPALVGVLSFAVCRQGPYLVMEREEGEPADAWVRRIGPLPEKIALSVSLEAARGLRQAAFHGALHGDLGPASVLVDVTGRVRVRGVGLRAVFSLPADVVHAPEFASPERLRGTPAADVRSDVYSLGAVLYYLLTGKPVYEGDREAILRQQAANAIPDVRESRPDVSEETVRLLRKLLHADADLRPQTWDQLLVEFERRVPGRVSTALRGNLNTRVRRYFQANPWVIGGIVAGLLLVAGVWRVSVGSEPSSAEKFRDASATAAKLRASGDVEGARAIYRRYLSGTGDAAVEREAARLYDELR